jgi:hypothetical protein
VDIEADIRALEFQVDMKSIDLEDSKTAVERIEYDARVQKAYLEVSKQNLDYLRGQAAVVLMTEFVDAKKTHDALVSRVQTIESCLVLHRRSLEQTQAEMAELLRCLQGLREKVSYRVDNVLEFPTNDTGRNAEEDLD